MEGCPPTDGSAATIALWMVVCTMCAAAVTLGLLARAIFKELQRERDR